MNDFETRRAELEGQLNHGEREHVVSQLRSLHEAWARAILEVDDVTPLVQATRSALTRGVFVAQAEAASHQLDVAVRWQWQRGAVDDVQRLGELRVLQLSRAWLLMANPLNIPEARALTTEVMKDARISEELRKEARTLLEQLDRPMN
ncbi:MAG: hypothetical protein ACO1OB_28445 [Archangium sp.]